MFVSNFVRFLMPILKWGVDSFPKFAFLFQFHEILLLCTFLAQTIYTLLKRRSLKWKFLRIMSVQVKICQIFYADFETRSRFLSILCIALPVSWKITPLYFFSSNNIYFAQKEAIKKKIFETYECSGENFSNFLCQFWNDKSILLQILYPSYVSWNITPLYFFSSNNIYFAHKELIKVKVFGTFEGSGQNLPNSLC